jgi:hypothetical protein
MMCKTLRHTKTPLMPPRDIPPVKLASRWGGNHPTQVTNTHPRDQTAQHTGNGKTTRRSGQL